MILVAKASQIQNCCWLGDLDFFCTRVIARLRAGNWWNPISHELSSVTESAEMFFLVPGPKEGCRAETQDGLSKAKQHLNERFFRKHFCTKNTTLIFAWNVVFKPSFFIVFIYFCSLNIISYGWTMRPWLLFKWFYYTSSFTYLSSF